MNGSRGEVVLEALERTGGPRAVVDELSAMRANLRALDALRESGQLSDRAGWVAIYRGALACTGGDLASLLESVDELGIPRRQALITQVLPDDALLIL